MPLLLLLNTGFEPGMTELSSHSQFDGFFYRAISTKDKDWVLTILWTCKPDISGWTLFTKYIRWQREECCIIPSFASLI